LPNYLLTERAFNMLLSRRLWVEDLFGLAVDRDGQRRSGGFPPTRQIFPRPPAPLQSKSGGNVDAFAAKTEPFGHCVGVLHLPRGQWA
jgi:hypothetical protein